MEAFSEAEIQSCHKAYEARIEKLKDEDEQYLEWQITGYELEQSERFVSILRNSFFVNPYAYVETYMTEQYYRSGEQEPVKREVIATTTKIMAKGLVDVDKIPHWEEIYLRRESG
jgi:hypothetical protein